MIERQLEEHECPVEDNAEGSYSDQSDDWSLSVHSSDEDDTFFGSGPVQLDTASSSITDADKEADEPCAEETLVLLAQ